MDKECTILPIAELEGHEDRVWTVAWNPARPLLASCSADRTVRLYHYTQQPEGSASPYSFQSNAAISTEHMKTVRSIAWSPSGQTLATASFDSNIGIWEQTSDEDMDDDGTEASGNGDWECVTLLEGHETECKSVAFSSDGSLLASCSRDKTVWVWEVHPDADFECLAVLMEHSQDVKCVAWHPREEILASASYDDTVRLYIDDNTDGDWFCCAALTGHTSTVWSLAWSPDGRYLASASDDKTIRIWTRPSSQAHQWVCVTVLGGTHKRAIYSVSWGPGRSGSGGWLASTGSDGHIFVWEFEADTPAASPKYSFIASLSAAHGVHDVNCISWCPRKGHERLLATCGDDGNTRIWIVQANV
ncbi:WD40 repeat-like protein [Fistulina hepatica ATCC 64428]|uniref:Probable cytosolic iron-sulfur protein assembly protein 1 n=1 Tax=Fistulina hepatica ATCC 64428 TaxID=1128425 RepID=A0A0D7ACV0_9AGAR|nr:WD40 repeat-like protein [Fistulina hepatica ATCC 64428]